ncbi:MAG TPA: dihydrolipoamide acetyltransferase family protein, partial [Rectinemataceae bacterium]|nr:dihydrolipoamide acetyltransferase family protein [Rectinemataceae bacterium]
GQGPQVAQVPPVASEPPLPIETLQEARIQESAGSSFGPAAPAFYPRSSPLARKIAQEMNVDIRLVRGSGPEGRVTEKDVRSFNVAAPFSPTQGGVSSSAAGAAGQPPSPPSLSRKDSTFVAVSGKRAIIAKRLSESFFSAPHYYLKKEILADNLVEARARVNEKQKNPISFNAILIKMAAVALSNHPEINVFWKGDKIERRSVIDIGLAVALPDGLITPVVRDCGAKGLVQIEAEMAALIEKAKTRGLAPEEYEGAGFTITNLGSFGIDEFTAIINPPASAILAVGAVSKKAVVRADDSIGVGRTMALTLGCDHRTVDGAVGARFLADLAAMLEDPFRALL